MISYLKLLFAFLFFYPLVVCNGFNFDVVSALVFTVGVLGTFAVNAKVFFDG